MNWIFLALAVALFIGWIVVHFVLALTIGVFNLLWMIAVLFVFLWAAQWCT